MPPGRDKFLIFFEIIFEMVVLRRSAASQIGSMLVRICSLVQQFVTVSHGNKVCINRVARGMVAGVLGKRISNKRLKFWWIGANELVKLLAILERNEGWHCADADLL